MPCKAISKLDESQSVTSLLGKHQCPSRPPVSDFGLTPPQEAWKEGEAKGGGEGGGDDENEARNREMLAKLAGDLSIMDLLQVRVCVWEGGGGHAT